MNNSKYAAEQIIDLLKKRGWVSTYTYDCTNLVNELSNIILNASLSNVNLSNPTNTFDSAVTYTQTFSSND